MTLDRLSAMKYNVFACVINRIVSISDTILLVSELDQNRNK